MSLSACGQSSTVHLGYDDIPSTIEPAPSAMESDVRDAGWPQQPADDEPASTPPESSDTSAPQSPASPSASGPRAPSQMPQVTVCDSGFADCDGVADNGCEADLQSDPAHCGQCQVSCPHADCVCEQGARVLRCPPGYADCDGFLDNGCEANLETDLDHCGACDAECHARGKGAVSAECIDGTCQVTCTRSLLTPTGDCDGNPDNGCETPLWDDPENCGGCGVVCPSCNDTECLQ